MDGRDAECRQPAGEFVPRIDLKRCEGKAACIEVCPEDVFELLPITEEDNAALGIFARFKLRLHGGKVAYAVRAEACRACGLCIPACPERAIKLQRNRSA